MRLHSTLLLLAAGCAPAFAAVIPQEKALGNALEFIGQNRPLSSKLRAAGKAPSLSLALSGKGFYAFNINGDSGYVISSCSDLTQPVLGYSDHGSINPADMSEGMKYWLESISEAVDNIEAGIPQAKTPKADNHIAHVADKQAIAPLVKSKWNQGDPYNLMTPPYTDSKSGAYNAHSATGCVATATTQVMYYWKWPQAQCKEIPSYTYNWSGNVNTMPALPPVTFNWDSMTDTYSGSSSQESKEAVAQLMLYAGCGMQSGYAGATGATSGNALNALKKYFDYNSDAYNTYHLNYTFQEWEDLFYNELAAGRPLLMGADNYERTGGHEFVCDGYDGNGLFHINWGWGGWDDGYFVLTVMAPDNQGIGGSTDANGYSMGQNVCINLCPSNVSADTEIVRASISNLSAGQSKLRKNADGTFKLNFNFNLRTLLMRQYEVEHAFRLTSADNTVAADELALQTINMDPSARYSFNASVELKNLADGTYTLAGISRAKGTTPWIADDNSDRNNLVLTVAGDEMTVTVMPGKGRNLQVNSVKLIGATVSGEWQKVVYNITNNGNDFYGETYLFVDGKRSSGNTISIPAGETMDIYYKFQPSNQLGAHNFVLAYSTNTADAISNIHRMFNIECMWKADGTVTALPKATSTNFEVPADAVALYIYGTNPRTVATSKANPNLVLYFDEDATISARTEKLYRRYISNLVFGSHATQAAFTEGYDAAVPIPFTADEVSYTRENMPAWSTVALPFDVDEVTVEGEPADWFTSADDSGKSLFVKKFSANRRSTLLFAHSENMKANTPYFVGLKGDLNGSSFDHTGKAVTFTGHNALVNIEGENTASFETNGVKFIPCFRSAVTGSFHAIDDAMENFVRTDKVEPFHGYISSSFNYDSFAITYNEGESTALGEIVAEEEEITPDTPVYNILGVRVGTFAGFDSLDHGIYIVAGRKIAK